MEMLFQNADKGLAKILQELAENFGLTNFSNSQEMSKLFDITRETLSARTGYLYIILLVLIVALIFIHLAFEEVEEDKYYLNPKRTNTIKRLLWVSVIICIVLVIAVSVCLCRHYIMLDDLANWKKALL